MHSLYCSACNNKLTLKYKLRFNIYECASCKLLTSDASFDHSFTSYDTEVRDTGLKQLRLSNFEIIIAELKKIMASKPNKIKGLEIGCGTGWWLETCKKNNIDCIGIEPEQTFIDYHKQQGLNVIYGFYPQAGEKYDEGFDFIIFNDVFEHIPDLDGLIKSLGADLKDDGVLIINIPMSNGFFYKTATLLNRFNIKSFLGRMWQFNFHSPHMNYFNAENLKMLLSKHGFNCIKDFKLNTLDFTNLKQRIATDNKIGKLKAIIITTALSLLKPIILSSKPDIKVFFFNKQNVI